MNEPIQSSQSFVCLKQRGDEKRLCIDFSLMGYDEDRAKLILRTALSVLSKEEYRICVMRDCKVHHELNSMLVERDDLKIRES